MIAELVLSVCMITDPGRCKDVTLPIMDEVSVMDLATKCSGMNGQLLIKEWMEGHPNWRVHSWKCQEVHSTKYRSA